MQLTPVLSAHWDDADSWTIEGYRRSGGYEGLRLSLIHISEPTRPY